MLVRLLRFTTLECGCVVGLYKELGSPKKVAFIEEKGWGCRAHRRNRRISEDRLARDEDAHLSCRPK